MKSADGTDAREYPLLLRAVDGDDIKLSTVVSPRHDPHARTDPADAIQIQASELEAFHTAYGSLLKVHMTPGLRKRDKKREKLRAERAALRKKKLAQDIVIEGPKRGNGRSKRQRRVKAAKKLEEARARIRAAEARAKKSTVAQAQ